jgi:hypothetical protein
MGAPVSSCSRGDKICNCSLGLFVAVAAAWAAQFAQTTGGTPFERLDSALDEIVSQHAALDSG